MNKWGWFLVSIGCLIVMISAGTENLNNINYILVIEGIAFIIIGLIMALKGTRKVKTKDAKKRNKR